MPEHRSVRVGRRSLLIGAASVLLTGCDIRLQDDAPRIPLVPTRQPIPAESTLLALLGDTRLLARLSAGAGTRFLTHVAFLHETQADVLAAALERAGVPVDEVMSADPGSASPGAGGTSPTATSPPATGASSPATPSAGRASSEGSGTSPSTSVSPRRIGDLEAAAIPRAAPVLAGAASGLIPTLVSLHAQRGATAHVLGATVAWPVAPEWASPVGAAAFLEATRAAVYALEVVAGQAKASHVRRADRTLATLHALASDQERASAGTAPQPQLGYALPFRVSDDRSAVRLAKRTLTDLTAAYGSHLDTLESQRTVALEAARWLAAAAYEAHRWGHALPPFPGLS